MIIVKFAHTASVGSVCLCALLVILLLPFNAFAQREYGPSPRGFAFDTQLCYREECDKVANTKYELPCCREQCNWKSCVSNSHDPGASGKTECAPHYQIYTNCLERYKASKNPPTVPSDPVVGTWAWEDKTTVKMFDNGTFQRGKDSGSWQREVGTNEIVLNWDSGFIDKLTLSSDGKSMKGKGYRKGRPNKSWPIGGTKIN
jgi:hypothetical protein